MKVKRNNESLSKSWYDVFFLTHWLLFVGAGLYAIVFLLFYFVRKKIKHG